MPLFALKNLELEFLIVVCYPTTLEKDQPKNLVIQLSYVIDNRLSSNNYFDFQYVKELVPKSKSANPKMCKSANGNEDIQVMNLQTNTTISVVNILV